jgi:hypothetical protein
MRDQLPEECERELDYAGFIETLALLEGEAVLLSIEGVSRPRPEVTSATAGGTYGPWVMGRAW